MSASLVDGVAVVSDNEYVDVSENSQIVFGNHFGIMLGRSNGSLMHGTPFVMGRSHYLHPKPRFQARRAVLMEASECAEDLDIEAAECDAHGRLLTAPCAQHLSLCVFSQ